MLNSHEEKILNSLVDAVADRQHMLANNLTNAKTPGWVRQDIDFGMLMKDLENSVETGSHDTDRAIEKATYRDEANPCTQESELSAMLDNHLKYILMIKINGHVYQHMEEATQSGRAA